MRRFNGISRSCSTKNTAPDDPRKSSASSEMRSTRLSFPGTISTVIEFLNLSTAALRTPRESTAKSSSGGQLVGGRKLSCIAAENCDLSSKTRIRKASAFGPTSPCSAATSNLRPASNARAVMENSSSPPLSARSACPLPSSTPRTGSFLADSRSRRSSVGSSNATCTDSILTRISRSGSFHGRRGHDLERQLVSYHQGSAESECRPALLLSRHRLP